MAGHLPIKTTNKHILLVDEIKSKLKELEYFKRVPSERGGYFQRLDESYKMDEEHGLKDDEIVAYVPEGGQSIDEIHLNSDMEINIVYLVM